jgi:HEAT repeat protein
VEQVLHTSADAQKDDADALVAVLGEALNARSRSRGTGGLTNPFLNAVATQTVDYQHPPRARVNLARLLGWLPLPSAVPHLAKALDDLEARDMARCSLESNPGDPATDALIGALDAAGTNFRAGVVNSLAHRKGERVAAALRKAAEDPHPEIRTAAFYALAAIPDAAHAAVLEKGARATGAEERRHAHIARIRLAESLRAAGNRDAAAGICRSVLAGDADEPQKKAARLALGA